MNENMSKARALLRKHDINCAIVSDLRNIRYISGFSGSSGLLLLFSDRAILYIDSRYEEQAMQQAACCHVQRHGDDVLDDLGKELAAHDKIAFEGKYVSVDRFNRMQSRMPGKTWTTVDFDVLRAVKSREELVLIEAAVQLADRAFAVLLEHLRVGMTENEAAGFLEFQLRKLGASGTAFSIIVA